MSYQCIVTQQNGTTSGKVVSCWSDKILYGLRTLPQLKFTSRLSRFMVKKLWIDSTWQNGVACLNPAGIMWKAGTLETVGVMKFINSRGQRGMCWLTNSTGLKNNFASYCIPTLHKDLCQLGATSVNWPYKNG